MVGSLARVVALETLAEELRWYAAQNRLSNASLARLLDMPETTVRRLCEGKAKDLKSDHARAIGRVLGRQTDEVIELFAADRRRAGLRREEADTQTAAQSDR
jgi:plasmid maintenance system antidote protein VapI